MNTEGVFTIKGCARPGPPESESFDVFIVHLCRGSSRVIGAR